MAQTLATINSDLYLDKFGNIAIKRDLESVIQSCEEVAKTRLGEMVLNLDGGIPFFETIFNGVPNQVQFDSAIRSALLQEDGVLEVVSLVTSVSNFTLNYNAIIRTIYGVGIISGEING